MAPLPTPVRAALGLAAITVEQARTLPDRLLELPVRVVSTALQFSVRIQQRYAELTLRGDELLGSLHEPPEEPPSWATFDDEQPEPAPEPEPGLAPDPVTGLAPDPVTGLAPDPVTGLAPEAVTAAAASVAGEPEPAGDAPPLATNEAKPRRRRAEAPPVQPEPSPFDTAPE
jgi:hypothetical protein